MVSRFFKRAAASPDAWRLDIDVQDAERRKRERVVRLNTVTVPRLRVIGYGLVSVTVLLHNHFAFGSVDWSAWMRLNVALAVYSAITWYLLHLFYSDLKRYFDLGVLFLATDLWMDGLAIYVMSAAPSGAGSSSWPCSGWSTRHRSPRGARSFLRTLHHSVISGSCCT
jgi:hypothetical protein